LADAPAASLRARNADALGLGRALAGRLLPILAAGMVFLAALATAGVMASQNLAGRWQAGAAGVFTVQVPQPDEPAESGMTRAAAVTGALHGIAGIRAAHRLSQAELATVLTPWLGEDAQHLSVALPAVFEVKADPAAAAALAAALPGRLAAIAPGSLVEADGAWAGRLASLGRSLQTCAILVLGLVIFIAVSVVSVATRAGLAARRDAIDILHGLGATDGLIAGRFARRLLTLTFAGGIGGALAAVPLLYALAVLCAPFAPGQTAAPPAAFWEALAALPPAAGLLGWCTAQVTVRAWLSALP
jgi:cell division transport system permease protein